MEKYIPKSALVAEIERRTKEHHSGYLVCLKDILSFIDTLEVKEVNLDSDIRTYLTNHFNIYEDGVLRSKKSGLPLRAYDTIKVAKHFFELGLKAQKGDVDLNNEYHPYEHINTNTCWDDGNF